jgi:hypothetical protein
LQLESVCVFGLNTDLPAQMPPIETDPYPEAGPFLLAEPTPALARHQMVGGIAAGLGGSFPRFNLQPEFETPEDSSLLQVKPLPDASRCRAFQSAISLAEVLPVSRLIMNNCFPQADFPRPIQNSLKFRSFHF